MRKLTPFIVAVFIGVLGLIAVLGYSQIFEGVSMQPTFGNRDKDVLYINPFLDRNLTGSIVVFHSSDYDFPIAHRVILDEGKTVVTQGDNRETNPLPDDPITKGDIEGVVFWSSDVSTRMGLIVFFCGLIISPLFVWIFSKIGA